MQRLTRATAVLGTALLLMAGLFLSASPQAEAHGPGDEFRHASAYAGTTCPTDYTKVGQDGTSALCTPAGNYVPLTDAAECATVGAGARMVQGYCSFSADTRPCNTALFTRAYTTPVPNGQCIWGVLHMADGEAQSSMGVPACIESSLVQERAPKSYVGDDFIGPNGIRYTIVTGAPFCQFNCLFGFDINCDNRIGDFCPSGLNLWKVADVASCLRETSAAN